MAALLNGISSYAIDSSPYFPEEAKQIGYTVDFINERAFTVKMPGTFIPIALTEEQNTIEIECTDITNPNDEYYITVYERDLSIADETNNNIEMIRCIGPIRLNRFKLCGLENGKTYVISFSSTGNVENISGTLTASYTEENK